MTLRRRVLLICREPALLLELQTHFSPRTHEVFATPDESASVRLVYELQPDAVLIAAPDGCADGWLAFVQSLRSLSRVPIVVLAGSAVDAEAARARGASVCLLPPYDGKQVAAEVNRLTQWHAAARTEQAGDIAAD